MTELVLIRGLPGAGKSTYAQKHFPGHKHLEADMYFNRTGTYKFDPKKLNSAHTWCQGRTHRALSAGHDVVVTNTFTMEWPPRSGKLRSYPEIDRAVWFRLDEARLRINPAQSELLDHLVRLVEEAGPAG